MDFSSREEDLGLVNECEIRSERMFENTWMFRMLRVNVPFIVHDNVYL